MPNIVHVSTESIPLIRELALNVWPQTYRGILADKQIDYMMDMMYSVSSLEQQMRDGANFIILYDEDIAAGFASYQQMTTGVYKLHKIYVLPHYQGKGYGKFIIDYLLRELKKKEAASLHLQVNRKNKAKSFYENLGFVKVDEIKLDIGGGWVMDDFIMEIRVK